MIYLYDGYVILVDDMQYTLAKDTGKFDKKGSKVYNRIAYFGELDECLEYFRQVTIRLRLQEGTYSLRDAMMVIKKETDIFKQFTNDLMEGTDGTGKDQD